MVKTVKVPQYSLDNITPIASYVYSGASAICLPPIIRHILSSANATADKFSCSGTLLKPFDKLIKLIESKGGRLIVRNQAIDEMIYMWGDHSYLDIDYSKKSNYASMAGWISDPKLYAAMKKIEKEYICKDKKNMIFTIVKNSYGLEIRNMGNGSSPFIEENYTTDVIEGIKYVTSSFAKDPPVGRIAVFSGEPGTGKTYLIRSMLTQLDCVFLIIPSNMVDSLDKPEFMPLLLSVKDTYSKPIVLVIEDGDVCLVPRKNDNISTITSLLNLSDGILGAILDIRLVVSTNASIKDMDHAIMRPGRLCKQIYVGPLAYEQANKVFQRISKDDKVTLPYSKLYTLAEIYDRFNNKDTIMASAPLPTRKIIGFSANPIPEDAVLNKVER